MGFAGHGFSRAEDKNNQEVKRMKEIKQWYGRRREAFTLIELLIVIVIIGLLATIMMLASGSGTSQAKATAVIADIRSLKSAASLYYAGNMTTSGAKFGTEINKPKSAKTLLGKYAANADALDDAKWCFASENNGRNWYVGMSAKDLDNDVLEIIGQMAKEAGIFGVDSCKSLGSTPGNTWTYAEGFGGFLVMKVR